LIGAPLFNLYIKQEVEVQCCTHQQQLEQASKYQLALTNNSRWQHHMFIFRFIFDGHNRIFKTFFFADLPDFPKCSFWCSVGLSFTDAFRSVSMYNCSCPMPPKIYDVASLCTTFERCIFSKLIIFVLNPEGIYNTSQIPIFFKSL